VAKDTRRRFEIEAQKFRPLIRDAFLQAVADIKRGTDLDALIAAIERNDVPAALTALKLGPEYFAPLDEAVRATFAGGGIYMLDTLPMKNPRTGLELVIRFQGRNPRAESWVTERSSTLITRITDGQRETIRDMLSTAIGEGQGPRTTALDLVGRVDRATGRRSGGAVGLTDRDARAARKYRDGLAAEGRKADQVERMAEKYRSKLLKLRGETIARTETTAALNAGRQEGIAQLVESGEVPAENVTGVWQSAADMRVRDSHVEMDQQERPIDEPFLSPIGGLMLYPGDTSNGASAEDTINCRCTKSIVIDWLKGVK